MKRTTIYTIVLFLAAATAFGAPSNEVFDPNGLVKNPYQFKGRSGILNTNGTPILMPNGAQLPGTFVPFACMRFEKMLDEHTAMFEVEAYEEGVLMPQGELAVIVKDSVAPDPSRRWRILVEGPMPGWNGYGAKITVTAIRFDGYYVPPPPTPEELAQQEAARKAQQARQAAAQKAEDEAQAKRRDQVDQEIARREAAKLAEYKLSRQAYCDTLAQGEAKINALKARQAAANKGWAKAQAKAEAQTGGPQSFWKAQHCDDASQQPVLSEGDKFFIRQQVEQEMEKQP